jgi:hypothetical protein
VHLHLGGGRGESPPVRSRRARAGAASWCARSSPG